MENKGLVTVSLSQMPYITEKIGVPRAVAVEFPFGMIWGQPGDREMHRRVIGHMVRAAVEITGPGTIVELPYSWPEELFKKRDWFPAEKPPWMASQEKIREMLDFLQHGNPLE